MTATLLQLMSLSSGYGRQRVLRAINLTVAAGEIASVSGPNAAGKTTLLATIAGHVPASTGRILFNGHDITRWPAQRRARAGIGLVPQGKGLFASLTVAEHLTVTGAPRRAREETLDLLPHLRTRLRHKPGELSGGEQQMLALARALARQPRLLLLDEPGEGLAVGVRAELANIITSLAASGSIVVITEHGGHPETTPSTHHLLDRGALTPAITPIRGGVATPASGPA